MSNLPRSYQEANPDAGTTCESNTKTNDLGEEEDSPWSDSRVVPELLVSPDFDIRRGSPDFVLFGDEIPQWPDGTQVSLRDVIGDADTPVSRPESWALEQHHHRPNTSPTIDARSGLESPPETTMTTPLSAAFYSTGLDGKENEQNKPRPRPSLEIDTTAAEHGSSNKSTSQNSLEVPGLGQSPTAEGLSPGNERQMGECLRGVGAFAETPIPR